MSERMRALIAVTALAAVLWFMGGILAYHVCDWAMHTAEWTRSEFGLLLAAIFIWSPSWYLLGVRMPWCLLRMK